MDVYVISLANAVARREQLRKNFVNYYNKFNVFTACDYTYSEAYLKNGGKLKKNKLKMTPSEIACSLSHLKVMELLVNNNLEAALVLEDDILGTDENIDQLMSVYSTLPKNSLLITGGQEGLKSYKSLYGIEVQGAINVFKIPKIYYRYLARTCCYVVSKDVAMQIIKIQGQGLDRADQWDTLLMNCNNVYFCPLLKHPLLLDDSVIEKERKINKGNNFMIAMMREGFLFSLYYYLRKIVTAYWANYKGYINIKNKI